MKNGYTITEKAKENIEKNLTCRYLTSENARELQLKGAEARKRNNQRQRNMQDIAKWMLNMPMDKNMQKNIDDIVDVANTKDIDLSASEAMVLVQIKKALEGDTSAFIAVRDTAGEKPKEQLEVTGPTIDDYAKSHKVKF